MWRWIINGIFFSFLFLLSAGAKGKFFEGKVVYDITTGDEHYELAVFTKGSHLRLDLKDLNTNQRSTLIFSDDGIVVVDHKQKLAMYLPALPPQFQQLLQPSNPKLFYFPDLPASSLEVLEKGGKVIQRLPNGIRLSIDQAGTKSVKGRQCQRWIFQNLDTKERVEVCLARGLGSFFLTPDLTRQMLKELKNSPIAQRLFPLEMVYYRNNQKETTIIVTDIDTTPPSASVFQIPRSYRIQQPFGNDH